MVKNLPASAGSTGLIPGLERTPGEGNDNPLQYSCLGNSVDRGAWQTPLQFMGSQKGQTQLSNDAKYLSYIYTYIYVNKKSMSLIFYNFLFKNTINHEHLTM